MATWSFVRETFAPDPLTLTLASGVYEFAGSTPVLATTPSVASDLDTNPYVKLDGIEDTNTPFVSSVYTYDGNGNVQTATVNGLLTTYTYTVDGDVLTATSNGRVETYSYENGQLTGSTVVPV